MTARPLQKHVYDAPPRIRKLHAALIRAIPRVPNDRASFEHMQRKGLRDLSIDYANWCARYVGTRPRTVSIEPAALGEARWKTNSVAIDAFLEKVRRGDDLTPHLSFEPLTRGYAVAAGERDTPTADHKWLDKDFLLHTMGYHHFHLCEAADSRGCSNELIIATVGRDTFRAITITDHSVFDFASPERARLHAVHREIAFRGHAPGTVLVGALIATSGHMVQAVHHATECHRVIAHVEPQLDDPGFIRTLYPPEVEAPTRPRVEWAFSHLDLAIFDKAKPALLVLKAGWN
jgi:hypothetical protein